MAENSKKPRIRFKGFTEAWEQRKLWNYTIWDKKFNGVDSYKQPKIIKYPYVLADVFKNIEDRSGTVRLLSTGSYIGYTTKEKAGENLCSGEIVAIPWGGVANVKYYKGFFVTADNRIATSNNLKILTNKYLYWWMESNINQIQNTYRGASIQHPSMNDILDLKIDMPLIKEQENISNILDSLDNLITLHQRKYDKLLNVKKALLEKMFPKNGNNIPEIRFKGFTEAWEQRKLGDCGMFKSNGVDKLSKPEEIPVNLLNYMDVYNKRKITNKNACNLMQVTAKPNQLKDNNVLKGDVFFTPTSETADDIGHSKVIEESLDNTVYSYHLMRYRPHENTFYITFPNFVFDNNNIYKQMALLAQGVQRFVLSKSQFESISFSMPNIKEQEKISRLLENLDNHITLHQRECEKLKNVKKSLLEKMFV